MPTVTIKVPSLPRFTSVITYVLTARQIDALRAGAKGNVFAFLRGSSMGGAKRRMIETLQAQDLLTDTYPVKTTEKGAAVLATLDAKGATK